VDYTGRLLGVVKWTMEETVMTKDNKTVKVINKGPAGGIYLVTYIGAAVYFVQHSVGFWGLILALLKAAVWPGFLLHKVLTLLRV